MKSDIRKEIINRLIRDYNFKEENNYLRYGVCPQCGKKELFTSLEKPYIVHCGRENKCGTDLLTKELYPDVFSSWSDRYISTKDEPYAAAAAYLQEARNIAVEPLKGVFTQERYQDKESGEQAATVRFTLADGVWWERIIDRPERFERKANFSGSYKGLWWAYPGTDLSKAKEIWICEGVFDAISLNQNGIAAVSVMSAVNYPDKALEELAKLCGDNSRPVIVWALDNGRAGERYAKKHAERSAEDGWRTAAALPGKNSNKRDWNDLHTAGKLRSHDVKRYRYYGDLLLAKSPRDKALIIFSFCERKEFHFTFDNRVFWFKLDIERYMKAVERAKNERNVDEDEARKIALKESDPETYPGRDDCGVGWLQKFRNEAAVRVISGLSVSSPKSNTRGTHHTIDALVLDAWQSMIDEQWQEGIVAVCSHNTLVRKQWPLINRLDPSLMNQEILLNEEIIKNPVLGNLPAVTVPFFPDNAVLITPLANLCLYWQRGSVRGLVKNEPQYNRLAFYESCNLDWVVGQYEAGCLLDGIDWKE